MTRRYLPPIERDTFTYVGVRVAIQLAAIDYRRRGSPSAEHHPTAVLNLAGRLRMLFPSMFPPLVFVAKGLSQGYTLRDLRFMYVEPAARALHKRRPR